MKTNTKIIVAGEDYSLADAIARQISYNLAAGLLALGIGLALANVCVGETKSRLAQQALVAPVEAVALPAQTVTPELEAMHRLASATAGMGQVEQQAAELPKEKQAKAKRERFSTQKPSHSVLNEHVQENVIVVKFKEGTHVRHRLGKLVAEKEKRSAAEKQNLRKHNLDDATVARHLDKVHQLLQSHPNHRVDRLFSREEPDLERDKTEAERNSEEEVADLNLYFHIYLEQSGAEQSAALVDELNALDSVEIAYAEPKSEPAAADIGPVTALLTSYQGYLSPGPIGVDAGWAWSYSGGRGDNVRVIDIEGGWNLQHEDLERTFHLSGVLSSDPGWVNHGTAVLGVIAAAENDYGVTGIAPRASLGVSSVFRYNSSGAVIYDFADAVNRAAAALTAGDIILIEQHGQGPASGLTCTCNCGQFEFVPMEYWQANYDAIRNATARGIIVIEAAGNGSMNLDSDIYGGVFNRSVRDSGAILIGAGTAGGRVPECWSNYGSRVDVEGWGDSVATLGYGDLLMARGKDARQWYTQWFSGTSSATPVVTGAAAAVQGMRKGRGLMALNSYQMRQLLSQTGTPQAPDGRNIGPLPDLRSAFDAHGAYSYIYPTTSYNWEYATIAPQGFRDYFFYSSGGNYFEFSTCSWATFDTVIEVYNPDGVLMASNDDFCGLQSYVAPWASVAGWCRVRVRGYNSYSSGAYWMYFRMF